WHVAGARAGRAARGPFRARPRGAQAAGAGGSRAGPARAVTFEIPLAGPKGEPVDLLRTILSHGVADLPPGRVDDEAGTYETTVALPSARPRTIRIGPAGPGTARIDVRGPRLGERATGALLATVRGMLNLD